MIKLTSVTHNDRVNTPVISSQDNETAIKTSAPKVLSASTEQTMMDARQTLAAMPEVDNAKVAEMKAALSLGELTADSDGLARSMLGFYQRSE